MELLKYLNLTSKVVVEDHGSTEGVILGISEPYNDGTITMLLDSLIKQYGLPDKSILDRRPQAYYPWINGTTEQINSETWKLFFPTLEYNSRIETNTETRKTFQKRSKKPSIF
jgi:hypothetical protein